MALTYARRAAGAEADQAGSAAFAAATAASVSASHPSDITAHAASVEGLITCKLRAAISPHTPRQPVRCRSTRD